MADLEVIIPDFPIAVYAGKDTTAGIFSKALCKMIIFYDSTECSSCKMSQMWEWQEVIEYSKGTNHKFVPVFVFSPASGGKRQLRNSLKVQPLDCITYIDKDQLFPRANPGIPEDKRLHTFLVDRDNKIVLIGNPIHNNTLWKPYKTTIRDLVNNNGILAAD